MSPNHRGTAALEKMIPLDTHLTLDLADSDWIFAPLFGTMRIGIWHRLVGLQHLQRLWQVSGCAHFVHQGNSWHSQSQIFLTSNSKHLLHLGQLFCPSFKPLFLRCPRFPAFLESQSMWTTIAVSEQPRNWSPRLGDDKYS